MEDQDQAPDDRGMIRKVEARLPGARMSGFFQGMGRRIALWSSSPGPSSAAWRSRHWIEKAVAGIDGLLIAVDHRGRVMFLNSLAEGTTGWPLKEAHGRALGEVFPLVDEPSGKSAEIVLDRTTDPRGATGSASGRSGPGTAGRCRSSIGSPRSRARRIGSKGSSCSPTT